MPTMRLRLLALCGLAAVVALPVFAQPADLDEAPALARNDAAPPVASPRPTAPPSDEAPALFYAVRHQATVYADAGRSRPYLKLRLREPVYVLEEGDGWRRVQTRDGAQGYVATTDVSDVWVRVSKRKQTVYVYRGARLLMKMPADLGHNFFSDKERRGSADDPDHWRTPDGAFFVVRKNARSQYHRALVLNYPTSEDAARGLAQGLISEREHDAIVRAEAAVEEPPMNTALGGMIEIHGHGTGRRVNWTQGCVAVTNEDVDRLWMLVDVGTPVIVAP